MNPHLLGKLWVALQFALLATLGALCLQQARFQPPGLLSVAFWLASVILGLWTLSANHPGNFNIRPEPKAHGHLVTSGPYRWVRHPGYAGALISYLAVPFLLDSWWTLIPVALKLIIIVLRTGLEDQALQEKLEGYQDYAQRVPYRLIPGIW